MRLLLVEDDPDLGEAVRVNLERSGFTADLVDCAGDAEAAIASTQYAALLLDLGLPDADGIDLIRALRMGGNPLPVLVLTARDALDERVRGLEAGADDYILKPFAHPELVARIRAVLRRPGRDLGEAIRVGNLAFHPGSGSVSVEEVPLTVPRRELALLELLIRRNGRVVTRATLEDELWGFADEVEFEHPRIARLAAQEAADGDRCHGAHPHRPRCRLHAGARRRMRRQRSLIGALITRFALVAGLGIVGTLLAHGLFSPIDLHYELDAIARRLQSHIERDKDGRLRIAVDQGLEQELGLVPGLQLRVVEAGSGQTLFQFGTSSGDEQAEIGEMSEWPVGHFELFDDEANRRAYGFVTKLDAPGGADIRMIARRGPAEARDMIYWLRTELFAELGPYILVATLVAVGIAVLTILQALAPLTRLSREAQAIVPGDTTTRLDEEGVPREVLPLVRAVNDTLGRLHSALAQERRFTASAAHELRTPLAAVQARLDALEGGPEILALRRSVQRMTRIVDQLLAVARLESGQVLLDDTVDLDDVALHAVAERAPLALAAGRSIELVPAECPLRPRGNAAALEQALGNLIDNALAVTPPGGTVEVEVTGDGRILVADRGPGFGEQDPARLFEPFARGRGARQSRSGAGLGLAIVRDTAELHGGRVIAEARPGGGAIVGILLPTPAA